MTNHIILKLIDSVRMDKRKNIKVFNNDRVSVNIETIIIQVSV